MQKAVRQAGLRTGLAKRVTPGGGYPDRPGDLGPLEVQTTMIHTPVLNRGGRGVHSPLDRLRKPLSVAGGGFRLTDRAASDCGKSCQMEWKSRGNMELRSRLPFPGSVVLDCPGGFLRWSSLDFHATPLTS